MKLSDPVWLPGPAVLQTLILDNFGTHLFGPFWSISIGFFSFIQFFVHVYILFFSSILSPLPFIYFIITYYYFIFYFVCFFFSFLLLPGIHVIALSLIFYLIEVHNRNSFLMFLPKRTKHSSKTWAKKTSAAVQLKFHDLFQMAMLKGN